MHGEGVHRQDEHHNELNHFFCPALRLPFFPVEFCRDKVQQPLSLVDRQVQLFAYAPDFDRFPLHTFLNVSRVCSTVN